MGCGEGEGGEGTHGVAYYDSAGDMEGVEEGEDVGGDGGYRGLWVGGGEWREARAVVVEGYAGVVLRGEVRDDRVEVAGCAAQAVDEDYGLAGRRWRGGGGFCDGVEDFSLADCCGRHFEGESRGQATAVSVVRADTGVLVSVSVGVYSGLVSIEYLDKVAVL